MPDQIRTEKWLPVLVGYNYEHVMGKAIIVQTAPEKSVDDEGNVVVVQPAKLEITIVSEGDDAQQLGDFVAAKEIVALSFAGVPVIPHTKET